MRILRLQAGKYEEPLYGTLEHVSPPDDWFQHDIDATVLERYYVSRHDHEVPNHWPQYKAISYAWGKPIFNCTLQLDGGTLDITEPLHGALRRFRDAHEEVTLWADAICIDQANVEEKNVQVLMMAHIFLQAQEVLVWLGELTPDDCAIFCMFEFMTRNQEKVLPFCYDTYRSAQEDFEHLKSEAKQYRRLRKITFEQALTSVATILNKPWFERLWVVQEAVLSRQLLVFLRTSPNSRRKAVPRFRGLYLHYSFHQLIYGERGNGRELVKSDTASESPGPDSFSAF